MRYIKKTEPPEFFTEAVKNFTPETKWKKFRPNKKAKLREYLIEKEQKGLCAYCEIQVTSGTSHIEHIKPRSKYPEDCFDYGNVIVSCNGKECRNPADTDAYDGDIHSCGHKRKDEFDETFFLSPIVEKDISDFFDFDKETGSISDTSSKDEEDRKRARYTVDLLNLDNDRLNQYRRNIQWALIKEIYLKMKRKELIIILRSRLEKEFPLALKKEQNLRTARQNIRNILSLENNPLTPFVTFLRFCFRNIINKAEQEKTLLQAD